MKDLQEIYDTFLSIPGLIKKDIDTLESWLVRIPTYLGIDLLYYHLFNPTNDNYDHAFNRPLNEEHVLVAEDIYSMANKHGLAVELH